MRKLVLLFIPLLFLTACDSTYELINQKPSAIKMERDKDILVTTAENGYFENKEYKNSGKKTTTTIVNKLRRYASIVEVTEANSYKKINNDDLLKYNYVIVPELYHWEDRATNMNFMPDKIVLGITVYDNTGMMLNHVEVKGESTKVTMANNDPIDLINEALDIYIRQLFEF